MAQIIAVRPSGFSKKPNPARSPARERRGAWSWRSCRRQTGPRPWPSPWPWCPKRSSVRPRCPAAEGTVMADLVWWLVEPGISGSWSLLVPAPQRHVAHAPAMLGLLPWRGRRCMVARRFSAACREQANVRTGSAPVCGQRVVQTSDDHAVNCAFQSRSNCHWPDGAGWLATSSV